jgi:hypothetical protein
MEEMRMKSKTRHDPRGGAGLRLRDTQRHDPMAAAAFRFPDRH